LLQTIIMFFGLRIAGPPHYISLQQSDLEII